MPTFAAYLDKFKQCKQTKLIIELKAQKIDKRESETLAAKIVEMVKRTGVEERVEYITFNRDAMLKLIELDPEAKVAYLTGRPVSGKSQSGRLHGNRLLVGQNETERTLVPGGPGSRTRNQRLDRKQS